MRQIGGSVQILALLCVAISRDGNVAVTPAPLLILPNDGRRPMPFLLTPNLGEVGPLANRYRDLLLTLVPVKPTQGNKSRY